MTTNILNRNGSRSPMLVNSIHLDLKLYNIYKKNELIFVYLNAALFFKSRCNLMRHHNSKNDDIARKFILEKRVNEFHSDETRLALFPTDETMR